VAGLRVAMQAEQRAAPVAIGPRLEVGEHGATLTPR
jgi:hypothetical protein